MIRPSYSLKMKTFHKTTTLLVSFTLAFSFFHILQAAPNVTTTTQSVSIPSAATGGNESPQTQPYQVDTTTTNATSGPTTTTTTISVTETSSESEPMTSTTDSFGVNADEFKTSSTILDHTETSSDDSADESSDGSGTELGGIEPKSINRASSDENSLSHSGDNDNDEPRSNLSIASNNKPNDSMGKKSSKYVSINMTLIDQIYNQGRKDEQETVDSWHMMGKKLKKGVTGIIGSAVPFALNMSQRAKISNNCTGAVLKWILSMNQLKAWAMRMLDASGKPIAGLLEGSMTMFGNYRQCLKVRAPDDDEIEFAGEFREYFRGKYCIIQAKPWLPEKSRFYNLNTKLNSLVNSEEDNQWYDRSILDELGEWMLAFNFVNIRFDVCVPSLCSREDIQKAVNFLVDGLDLKARVLRCEMDSLDSSFAAVAQVESSSQEIADALFAVSTRHSSSQFNLGTFTQLGWILIPLIAIMVVLIATSLSLTIDTEDQEKTNKFKHTIKSLSLKRSVNSHLNVDYDQLADDKPLSLYGIRFILVLWVILVESAVNLKFEYLRELMMLKELIFWWPMQFIINSTLQYDSFILLTAFTMGYKNCLNDGAKNAKNLIRFIVDKYIRLMPSIMFMVALVILLPLVYRGPVWNDYVTKQSAVCQSNGWVNSIFLQNYLPYDKIVSTTTNNC